MTALATQTKHSLVNQEAFDLNHPSIKLMHLVGGGFFNEEAYYTNELTSKILAEEVKTTGTLSLNTLESSGLTTQAKEVIKTALEVANSEHPEDLLIISHWARDMKRGLKLRSTSQILAAVAAAHNKTKPFIRKYIPAISQRVDDITQIFGAYRFLFQKEGEKHKGSLPHSLRKGLADALRSKKAFEIIKYRNSTPSIKDLLKMIGGDKKIKNCVSKGLYDYIVRGEVTVNAPLMLRKKAEFDAASVNNAKLFTTENLREAGVTFENYLSKVGASKESWEKVIPLMGEDALRRNFRNFEQHLISEESWNLVKERVVKASEKTSLFPFQYYVAYENVSTDQPKAILDIALDNSCKNLPHIPGMTLILADNSGSVTHNKISEHSTTTVATASNLLMSIVAKRLGPANTVIGVFGDRFRQVNFTKDMSAMTIAELIKNYASEHPVDKYYMGHPNFLKEPKSYNSSLFKGVGPGTETGLWYIFENIIMNKVVFDRIILLSDMCCYNAGDIPTAYGFELGENFNQFRSKSTTQVPIASLIEGYHRQVNPKCQIYSINLAKSIQSQVDPKPNIHLLSGWSEQLIKTIVSTEEVIKEKTPLLTKEKVIDLPSLDVIRKEFKVV